MSNIELTRALDRYPEQDNRIAPVRDCPSNPLIESLCKPNCALFAEFSGAPRRRIPLLRRGIYFVDVKSIMIVDLNVGRVRCSP